MTSLKNAWGMTLRREAEAGSFLFLDHGPLIDRELELVPPDERWIDDILSVCQHSLTRELDPKAARMTRQDLADAFDQAPGGHEAPDLSTGRAPAYHFTMRLRPEYFPSVPIAGGIGLRIGWTRELELYLGHVGYTVFPPARGHHYAERSCRLLFSLARRHRLSPLWITTAPDNLASRRTCERLGGRLVDIVDVPPDHPLYARGERRKCRYRINL